MHKSLAPSGAAALALRSYLVPEFALGSAENDLCCPLVAGHEVRFVSPLVIFCLFWYYWLRVQS